MTSKRGHLPATGGRIFLSALAFLALSACAGLTGPREDFTIYALNPAFAANAGARHDWQLTIDVPVASDLLDGPRIIVAPDGNQRQVYKGARWAERTPIMLQSLWLRAFESDGRLAGVGRAGSGLRADLILASDLQNFQSRYVDGSPVVEIDVHARLIDPRDRRVRAQRRFNVSMPAHGTAIGDVVVVFQQAVGELTAEIVDWTLQQGRPAPTPPAPNGG